MYLPGGTLIYAGDTGEKWGYFDETALRGLGVQENLETWVGYMLLAFTLLAALLSVVGAYGYIRDTLRGETTPHRVRSPCGSRPGAHR